MKDKRILITGSAGLVGQNLIIKLKEKGYRNIIAIDKHPQNTLLLKKLHPDIKIIESDLAIAGDWEKVFQNVDVVIMLHAQIGAKTIEPFVRNNIITTKNVLEAIKKHRVPYIVHVSSSVIESVANDFYTNTKKEQERLVIESGIKYCILRPTLMFGWFDRKHLGWISRFMEKSPIFPIPGNGRYIRQPLSVMDFCSIIINAIEKERENEVFNITGVEKIYYIDIIKDIKKAKKLHTIILPIPYTLFYILLKIAEIILREPPFTIQQLKALVAGDIFEIIPWWDIFNTKPTDFYTAINETFNHPEYSKIVLEF